MAAPNAASGADRHLLSVQGAARAVADYRLGFGSTGCSMGPSVGAPVESAVAPEAEDDLRRRVVCLYAGYCARRDAGQSDAAARAAARSELTEADALRRRVGSLAEASVVEEGLRLLREPQNARAVQYVAEELAQRGMLDGTEVALLINIADGQATPELLHIYRLMKRRPLRIE